MGSFYYRGEISYAGHLFHGWQVQPGIRTIQGEVEIALKKLAKSDDVQIIGSGRTDAGVHALKQIIRIRLPKQFPDFGLKNGLNSVLPMEIRVNEMTQADENFNPQFDAQWKTYSYLFTSRNVGPFHYPFITEAYEDIDFEGVRNASKLFIGTHDFHHFHCLGTPTKTTVREIYQLKVTNGLPLQLKNTLPEIEGLMSFTVTGSGFLKQMVRLIVGACFEYSRGKLSEQEIKDALSRKHKFAMDSDIKKLHLTAVAPPNGLYLLDVGYAPYLQNVHN